MKCVICKKPFEGKGNNPYPVKDEGRCCDECNLTKVVPSRMGSALAKIRWAKNPPDPEYFKKLGKLSAEAKKKKKEEEQK